ncbi:MAG: nuclear transport factor 2 family protein, partial [Mycobacterium sp.]|nr:nuclear transport factor 2 family protein [Mycobacterium sp.]
MSTRRTIEAWVEQFNAGDAAAISALYAEDAINHQIPLTPVVGREAIEEFHRETFAGGPL